VERVVASGPDRVEVAGRWFGVRGRRFVRPTLTIRRSARDPETRALADLEHKPWAAEDGELWVAVFTVSVDLEEAAELQLSVAPDITVALRPAGQGLAGSGDLVTAGESARTPVAKADPQPSPRRPRERLAATERLTLRLENAMQALELERERRAAAEQALENERSTGRRLQTELGRARAELDLAQAAQAEGAAAEAEGAAAEAELRAARTALHEHAGALESAREALAREQAEVGRLRTRLERGRHAPAVSDPPGRDRPTRKVSDSPGRDRHAPKVSDPQGPDQHDDDADEDGAGAAGTAPWTNPGPLRETEPRLVPAARVRPLNPSLRHRTNWLGRLLALLVLGIVIAAVWIVLHSTILH
jgi:hypothetical protein